MSLSGLTFDIYEASEAEAPDRIDFLTSTQGREVEPGDVDLFTYTWVVAGDVVDAEFVYRGERKVHQYTLTYTSPTEGTFEYQEIKRGRLEERKTGIFKSSEVTEVLSAFARGTYDGVLEDDDSPDDEDDFDGRASLKVSKSGAFSASIETDDHQRVRARGRFDGRGEYDGSLRLRDGTEIELELELEAIPTGHKVVGTVRVDGEPVALEGDQRVYHPRRNPAPQAGRYTMVVTDSLGDIAAPSMGDGWAVISVGPNGRARIAGVLGDLSRWSTSTSLRQDGDLTLMVDLYRKTGSIRGRLEFKEIPDVSDLNGLLHWTRPAGVGFPRRNPNFQDGFDVDREAVGSAYSRPAKGEAAITVTDVEANMNIELSGGPFITPLTFDATLTDRNRLEIDPSENTRLKMNSRTGNFGGLFFDNSGEKRVKRRISGVFLQKQNNAAGVVSGDPDTGRIFVLPN